MSEEPEENNCCEAESLNVWNHIKRVFLPIRGSMPNEQECTKLEGRHEALQKYAVWRRSTLFFSSPSVFLSMILGFVTYGQESSEANGIINGLGLFLFFMQEFADFLLLVAILCSAFFYDRILKSTNILRIGWIISIVLPFLPTIFPLEMIVKKWVLVNFEQLDPSGTVIFQAKAQLALQYAINMLPIIVTIPGSLIRACLKVRNLFPNSSLPGWILVVTSPFYSLVVLIAFVMVTQVAGNSVLLVGSLLLVLKPLVFMIWGSLFVGVNTPEVEKKIKILLNISLGLGALGFVMVGIWLVSADVGGVRPLGDCGDMCMLSYGDGIRLLFETIGRALVTLVVFCDFVVSMVLRDWEIAKKKNDVLGPEDCPDYEAFHQVLGNQWTPKKKKERYPDSADETKEEITMPTAAAGAEDIEMPLSALSQNKKTARSSTKTITEMPDGSIKIKEEITNADGSKMISETVTKKK
mmetsp:Transcript_2588/g.3821  ORF Transcript_2588/g.3821 Transcript_2588/m.3821 type:complete len:467 (-) Transcript_2588:252-1652(-)